MQYSATGARRRLSQVLIDTWRRRFDFWVSRRIPPSRQVVLGHRNIFIIPNRQGLGFLFVLGLMFLGAVNYEINLGFALVFLLLGVFVLSIFYTFRNLSNFGHGIRQALPALRCSPGKRRKLRSS